MCDVGHFENVYKKSPGMPGGHPAGNMFRRTSFIIMNNKATVMNQNEIPIKIVPTGLLYTHSQKIAPDELNGKYVEMNPNGVRCVPGC